MASLARTAKDSRRFALLFLFCLPLLAQAQDESAPTDNKAPLDLVKKPGRPKIALVLSGGGARGLAHVGVAKELERMRIPYDCIAGTSMGAIAGGTFATGMSLEEAENKVVNADWKAVFSDKPQRSDIPYFRKYEDYRPYFEFTLTLTDFKLQAPRNFVGVQNIGLFFRDLTGARAVKSFDDLPIPYRAVGTDIITGKPVVLSEGTVAEAMRASMTVPGVFPAISYKGHLLVDGGLSKNLPVSVGKELCGPGSEVIAVNVSTPSLKQDQLLSFLNIGEQVINIGMQSNLNEEIANLNDNDILITPELENYSSTDFEKVSELIAVGEKAVRDNADKLRRYQVSEAEYAAWRDRIESRKPALPVIEHVKITEMKWVNKDVMSDLLNITPGAHFDMDALQTNINRIFARGDFASIRYDLVNTAPGKADLLVTPEEKPGRDFVRFGLSLYSDFKGDAEFSAIASLRRAWLNRLDAEWRTDVQVGRNNMVYSEWYQPASLGSEFFVAPYAFYSDQHRDLHFENIAKFDYEYTQTGGGLELGSVFGRWGEFRAGVVRSYARAQSTTITSFPDDTFQQGGYTLRSIYDQLDNTHFPHSGGSFRFSYFSSSENIGADQDYERLEARATRAFTWNRNTIVAYLRGGTDLGTSMPYYDAFSLGGLFNLSAYTPNAFQGGKLASGSLLMYRRVSDLPPGLGKGIYTGVALEGGRVGDTISGYQDMDGLASSLGAYVAADTVLGPFYLLGAVGNNHHSSIYMALGISF